MLLLLNMFCLLAEWYLCIHHSGMQYLPHNSISMKPIINLINLLWFACHLLKPEIASSDQ